MTQRRLAFLLVVVVVVVLAADDGDIEVPCGDPDSPLESVTTFDVVVLESNIDVTDEKYAAIINNGVFNPGGHPVHHAQIVVKFASSPCTLDGLGNGLWSVIGSVANPQSTALNHCSEGSLLSGECFPFGPVHINMTVGALRWAQELTTATNVYDPIDFDYLAYFRDKDAKNATSNEEGQRPGGATCMNYAATGSANYWQCLGGAPNNPAPSDPTSTDTSFQDGCASSCTVMTSGTLKNCSATPRGQSSPLTYYVGRYTHNQAGLWYSCAGHSNSKEGCTIDDQLSENTAEFRAVEPANIAGPRTVYQYYADPDNVVWGDPLEPGYELLSPPRTCDPNTERCRFNYYLEGRGPRFQDQVPDPDSTQWLNFNSMTCRVPAPATSQDGLPHLMDPTLYMEIATAGGTDAQVADITAADGTWYDPNSASDIMNAHTCFRCNAATDPNCLSTDDFPDYDRAITASRFFSWNMGPKCRLYVPTSDPPHEVWDLKLDVAAGLFNESFELHIGPEDSAGEVGDNNLPTFRVSGDGEIAVVVSSPSQTSSGSDWMGDVAGVVQCAADISESGTFAGTDNGLWHQSVEAFPWLDNHPDDGCPGCTPLQQDSKESRALWYTITHDMYQAAYGTSELCSGAPGSPGQYQSRNDVFPTYCPGDGPLSSSLIQNYCDANDQQMCRPSNSQGVFSPCYIAAAFDQFYTAFQAWEAVGGSDETRPVWQDYQASLFMARTFSPYPSPNAWLTRDNGGGGDAFDPNNPTFIYQPLMPSVDDPNNPYRVVPYELRLDFYITDFAARPAPPIVGAVLTYNTLVSPCPFGNIGMFDKGCSAGCPASTSLQNAAVDTSRCSTDAPNTEDCAYVSFFVKKEALPSATYTIDTSQCWELGLDVFVTQLMSTYWGVPPIINNRTSVFLTGGEQTFPSASAPIVFWMRLRAGQPPIRRDASCNITLLFEEGPAEITLGEPLIVPSSDSSDFLLAVGACPDPATLDFTIGGAGGGTIGIGPGGEGGGGGEEGGGGGGGGGDPDPDLDSYLGYEDGTPISPSPSPAPLSPDMQTNDDKCGAFDVGCQQDDGTPLLQTLGFYLWLGVGLAIVFLVVCIPLLCCIVKRRKATGETE